MIGKFVGRFWISLAVVCGTLASLVPLMGAEPENGQGSDKVEEKAMEQYRKAAEQGYEQAREALRGM